MKVFITKYALTKGIVEAEGVADSPFMRTQIDGHTQYWPASRWHEDRSDAVAAANAMKHAKIASLEKQLARLRKLEFK